VKIDLKNKTALVCGSTQGIGKAIAVQLAECGASIILLARNEDKLKTVVQELNTTEGQKHQYFIADYSQNESIKALIPKISELQIDILINNTGGPPAGKAIDAPIEEYFAAFSAHLINNQLMQSFRT
jgi:3-oxoacyl-[acyl-carrier protein] reductase